MKDLKILTKLMISTFVLIALMVIMAVINNKASKTTTNGYHDLIENELEIEASARNVSTSMLMLRRHEKDFLLRLDLKYSDKHQKEMKVLLSEVNKIETIAKKNSLKEIEAKAKEIAKNVKDYEKNFHALIASWTKRGLSHDKGLQGAFITSVKNLEDELKKLNAMELELKMLSIRRYEKDYLLRYGDPASAEKYTKKTNDKVATLKGKYLHSRS